MHHGRSSGRVLELDMPTRPRHCVRRRAAQAQAFTSDAYVPVAVAGSVDVTPLLLNGWVGVDLFFVLSGFLVGRLALRRTDGLGWFWFRRAARTLPAAWACLAVIALALTAGRAWPRAGADFLSHTVLLQNYTGSVFFPAFWSRWPSSRPACSCRCCSCCCAGARPRRARHAGLAWLGGAACASRAFVVMRGEAAGLASYEET